MLDDLELQQVQTIEVDGDQVWAQHSIPALEGDFFQGLGRRASQVTLTGVLSGAEVADSLKNLRDKFRGAAPVAFVADIATATRIDQVLIEEMGVRELAGKPSRFEYAFTLREFIPATPPRSEIPPPPPPPPPPKPDVANLIVEVIVEGQPEFDHDGTVVEVFDNDSGTTRTIPNSKRTAKNVWEELDFPPGNYTVKATTAEPNRMTASKTVTIDPGETEHVILQMQAGGKFAEYFVIHFWFDKAFIEPCMRPVMRQIAAHAEKNKSGKKLLILGHTDLTGGDDYNQSLSERRARAAYAYLTAGDDLDTAVNEWNELRQTRPTGTTKTVKDTWGVRQYQQMLQDLGLYPGIIKDTHDTATDNAVRAFQADHGLSVDGDVGDQTWPVLIREYIKRDALKVDPDLLLPNVKDDCDGGKVRWLGGGELDPVKNTEEAWRPNRRTEFLFVTDKTFQENVKIPEPHTLSLPVMKYEKWCLGSKTETPNCFVKPHPGVTRKTQCSQPPEDVRWERRPVEPQTIVVKGRITFEDGSPYGDKEYVLIAPDGEFMNGERPSGNDRGRPIFGRTDANGNFTDNSGNIGYPNNPKRIGIFILELQESVLARLDGESLAAAKGPVVCKRLEGSAEFKVIVSRSSACQFPGYVHFEFEKSFIRPAAKRALRAIADFMRSTPASWRLLPIGHTDLQGSDAINTALGERRAKAVYGFLTGNPQDPANPSRSIWLNLYHDARENWGAREIQYMLLDLGYYCHHLTGVIDAETNRTISAYKNQAGLGNNSTIDDVFLERLFTDYITHEGATLPTHKFLSTVNWLSCGKQHPLDIRGGTPFAGRSELNRRVEFVVFTNQPNPAPVSTTDCSQYVNWQAFCAIKWLEFIGLNEIQRIPRMRKRI